MASSNAAAKIVSYPRNPQPILTPLEPPSGEDVEDGVDAIEEQQPARVEPGSEGLKAQLWEDLSALGVSYKPLIFKRYDLEEIALSLADVQDQRRSPQARYIRNWGGLFVRVLEANTGKLLFR